MTKTSRAPTTRALGSVLAAVLLTTAIPARAGGPDEAAAAALFQDAKQLAAAGDCEHALPKFEEAERLHPTVGTLLNVADCLEKLDRVASAWGKFKEAEREARDQNDADREGEASRRQQALAVRLAKLAIVVPPAARVPGFELRRDGALVGEGQWGSAMPVDVGQHKIEATAPGYKPWSTSIRIDGDGTAASVYVEPLEALPAGGAAVPAWGGQRIAGIAVGGAGVVGVVIGSVFGVITLDKASASKSHCAPNLSTCDLTGWQLQRDAHTTARVSDVAFALGGVAVVGGVVLFATAPGGAPKAPATARLVVEPTFGTRGAGFSLQGAW